jgi:hypothetical protein
VWRVYCRCRRRSPTAGPDRCRRRITLLATDGAVAPSVVAAVALDSIVRTPASRAARDPRQHLH